MLSRKVVRHLVERGLVTHDQVDEAVRMQGFFGGQVESHLLKLGYVDEASLGAALTEAAGAPFASGEHLRVISFEAMASMPLPLLEKHRLCPFRLEDRSLRVAMLDPRDRTAINEIQAATGYTVEPWVTTEFRLYQSLERNYRIRYPGVKPISLAPPETPQHGRLRDGNVGSASEPEPQVGLDGLPLDADVWYDIERDRPEPAVPPPEAVSPPAPARTEDSWESELPRPAWADLFQAIPDDDAPAPPPPQLPAMPPVSTPRAARPPLIALEEGLASATDRDAIADVLLGFCREKARRVALFAVGKDGLRGLAGRGRAFDDEKIRRITIPARSGTVFETALGSRDFFFGVVPALPANRDVYTALGGRLPANVLIVPVRVKDRTAALLYLDDDDEPMSRPDIPLVRRVAAKAGLAFELILLRNKLREI